MSNESKRRLFEHFAGVAKALGHAHRLEILELVAQGERNVESIARVLGLSVANCSQHLKTLRHAGMVETRKEGKNVFCRLKDDTVIGLIASLYGIAERNIAEVEKVIAGYFRERDSMEPISRAELIERLRSDSVILLDIRPEDEFAAGHLPKALNVPLAELESRLSTLSPDNEIIAYCRGPYCVMAFEAVATLRQHGFSARRLEGGYPEWQASAFPVEREKTVA